MRVLLSDDNLGLHQPLTELASFEQVELVCKDNWEEAKAELEESFDEFDAIILDGRGKLNSDSKDANQRHLTTALNWLREQKQRGNYITVVIFTAYFDDVSEFIGVDDLVKRIAKKGVGPEFGDLLKFLKKETRVNPEAKFRTALPAVLSFTEKYFSSDKQKLIRAVFEKSKSKEGTFIWKKGILDDLRVLNEALVDTIPQHYYEPAFELKDFVEKIKRESNPKVTMGNRASAILDFCHKANIISVPGPILNATKNTYYTASTFAAHNSETQSDYFPSTEMILGLVYSHFGCYHWFNQILNKD
jgi:hypothetical protein